MCPFYGYARQDRKAEGREPISARLLADLLTVAGADRVVSVDLHTGQIQGFFDGPGRPPHRGAAARRPPGRADRGRRGGGVARRRRRQARPRFSNCLGDAGVESDLAFIDKRRPKGTHNVAEATEVVGNVAGNVCILIDDMIDTAGTVVSRRQPAGRAGRRRGVGRSPPTACSRARPSTA